MVSSDTIVGIVGAVILTGAMIAVFYYEADRGDDGAPGTIGDGAERFDFRFTESDHAFVDSEDQSLTEEDSQDFPVDVPPYAFKILVEVEWQEHDFPELVGEPGYTIEVLDDDADDAVLYTSNASPLDEGINDTKSAPQSMDLTVAADSEEEAQETVDEYMQSEEVAANGRNWTVRVTLDDDGIDDPTGQAGQERMFDITVRLSHYVPELVDDTE